MAVEPLFPVALGRVQLAPDPIEIALQLRAISQLQGEASSNPDPGCAWTGDLNGVWQLQRHPVFSGLVDQLLAHGRSYLQELGFDLSQLAIHIQRCWPVVSGYGQVVSRHHHPNAHLSAVYYLNGDGSGRQGCLRLFPQRQLNELVPGMAVGHGGPLPALTTSHPSPNAAPWTTPWVDVAPRAGLLLLFPSGLDHAVLANQDPDDTRFSISLDLVLTAPPVGDGQAPPEYLAPHPSQWQQA
ncbi:hypothetical protein KBY58_06395 [Cyanobium sp. HWJ4-Hawea]|uniref:putative 2OG-Fe(II) oxygenase n=1 Tax=Cyanobium sp. HWJ4-Hawea TaxID=2823713 RepID=UPI0020CBB052|nr:putative 2OG-Fe(II) oxygenase [Cyanobium sp. HWJ4-Hawea]MCP9809059.1 hypothetical protein [Cyanobium sp. HWJ4-Hawea]